MYMATQVQFRRGTTGEHSSFTGAVGEVTVDTTLDTLRVHDGAQAGGFRIAKFSDIPSTFNFTLEADDSAGVPIITDGTGVLRVTGGTNITTTSDSAGTLIITGVTDITANSITSADSTGVTIADDLLLAGTLRAEDSATLSIDGAVAISGAVDSGAITSSGNVTSGGSFIIGSADINETDLEKIDGITNGTAAANKALVVDASKDIGTLGTVTASAMVVETISSADSTSVFFNDGITLSGPIKADDSATINIDDAVDVEGAVTASGGFVGDVTGNATSANQVKTVDADGDNAAYFVTFVDSQDSSATANELKVDGGLSYNPSTNVLATTATQAQYADLAERYRADKTYDEGHVVILGGSEEITESTQENDTRIAGVISERWAYLMNEKEDGPAVALKGKVTCKVVGTVSKGDLLVSSSTPGHAVASDSANPMAVIGRAMVDDSNTHPRQIFIKI